MKNFWLFLVIATFLIVTTGCLPASAEIPNDTKGSSSAKGKITANMTQMWSAGSNDLLFGSVDQVVTDEDGNIYLLDSQFNEIKVLARGGELQRMIGRKGDGPGEFRFATDLMWLPGKNLGVLQSMMGKIVRINTDGVPVGNPVGTFPLVGQQASGFSNVTEGMSRGGTMVFLQTGLTRDGYMAKNHSNLTGFNAEGKPVVTFLEHISVMDLGRPQQVEKDRDFPSGGRWTIGPDGRLFVANHRNQYRITVFDPQGNLVLNIERDFESWPRSEAEKQAFGEELFINNGNGRVQVQNVPEDLEPCIVSIDVLDDGTLWVLNSRGVREISDEIFRSYDVFDADGKFQAQVAVPFPGDGQKDRLFFLGDDRIIIASDHSGELEVFCYRIETQ